MIFSERARVISSPSTSKEQSKYDFKSVSDEQLHLTKHENNLVSECASLVISINQDPTRRRRKISAQGRQWPQQFAKYSTNWSLPKYMYMYLSERIFSVPALFASFIIRLFQLGFSAGTVFFSHNKSAGTVFRFVFSAKRTGPMVASNFSDPEIS